MGPSDIQLSFAFSYITFGLLYLGVLMGIYRSAHAATMIPKLAEPNRYPEITVNHIVMRMISGIAFISINAINISLALQIGITSDYIYDPTEMLSYIESTTVSDDTQALALLCSSLLRMTGTISILHGANGIGEMGHRDEQIRKRANNKVFWGLFCGLVLWFPEFWTEVGGQYFDPLKYISEFLNSTNMVN